MASQTYAVTGTQISLKVVARLCNRQEIPENLLCVFHLQEFTAAAACILIGPRKYGPVSTSQIRAGFVFLLIVDGICYGMKLIVLIVQKISRKVISYL